MTLLEELTQLRSEIDVLEAKERALFALSLAAPKGEKACPDWMAEDLQNPSPFIQYPVTIEGIGQDEKGASIQKPIGYAPMSWVSVRPCANGNTLSYLGILIGDVALSPTCRLHKPSGVLTIGKGMSNPCMWVPDLDKYVFGAGSWWKVIKTPAGLEQITSADIKGVWYMRALAELMDQDSAPESVEGVADVS